MENIYEEHNRLKKAAALAIVLARAKFDGTGSTDFIDWNAVATLAKTNPPSDKTKALVMELLRG